MSVAELLPSGLAVNEDTSAFVLTLDPVSADLTLGAFCGPCAGFGGSVTTDKPAFSGSVSTPLPLPGAVRSVTIADGRIDVSLTNGFGFDPINPSATADGSLTLTLLSGTTTVAQVVVDGATETFAPGTTLDLTLDLLTVEMSDDLELEVALDSPEGDEVTMSASDAIGLSIGVSFIEVSEASVDLGSQPITQETELDLSGVDLGDRLHEGTIFLDIANPFGVTGDLALTIDPPTSPPIVKPLPLSAGESEVAISFDDTELGLIVGQTNQMTISGTVDGNDVTLAPDMVIGVETRLRVTIEVGGTDDDNGGEG